MSGYNDGNIFFIGDVDDALEQAIVVELAREVKEQSERTDGHIDLWINSVGGYVSLMQHIVALMEIAKRSGVIVRTIVPGIAFSAGSMIAIAGTPGERYIDKTAEHLIHYGQTMSFETTPAQIERFTQYKERGFKNNLNHYKKYSNIPNLESHMMDDGFFVKANDAIRWGMADKYMEKLTL